MKAGLFGKLPAKRDFIAANAPRRFLEVWEPWLQSGIATSRQMLGPGWGETYNRAPIWRFWLGADFTGEATIGAFMASIDGVGRSFPLTIFASEGSASLLPPEIDSNDSWCETTEGILLDALAPGATFEGVAAAVEAMAPPSLQPRASEISGLLEMPEGAVLVRGVDHKVAMAFRAARRFGHRRTFAAQSFWWTIGGDGYEPLALACVGLPLAARFADFLTGVFAPPPPEGA